MENTVTFQAATLQLVKYISDYFENIRSRNVYPAVEPGFMRNLIPTEAPEAADDWEDVFSDIENVIMPGLCHWQHPNFAAYFPSQTSHAAILAEMLSSALANVVISWKSSPSATELEVIVLDWLAKAMNLPAVFLSTSEGNGGGSTQGSSTESMMLSLFTARTISIQKLKERNSEIEDGTAVTKLIAYKSAETHSSFKKVCGITLVNVRDIAMDDKRAIRGNNLKKAIEEDRLKGLIPFYVCATLGSTSLLAFDNIEEIGAVCQNEGLWLHIDAAFAGNAFICPEYRYLVKGVRFADSLCISPQKWLKVPPCCSVLWIKNSKALVEACGETNTYLQCLDMPGMPNYTNWQIQCGRPFRSLKLWFVLRLFGIKRLQESIRNDIKLAHIFKELVERDNRFELIGENLMSLVCFRLKGTNEINKRLFKLVNMNRNVHVVCSKLDDISFLRFVVNSNHSEPEDINRCYEVIGKLADDVLKCSENQKLKNGDTVQRAKSMLE